jgi:hypothetical protein
MVSSHPRMKVVMWWSIIIHAPYAAIAIAAAAFAASTCRCSYRTKVDQMGVLLENTAVNYDIQVRRAEHCPCLYQQSIFVSGCAIGTAQRRIIYHQASEDQTRCTCAFPAV